VLADPIAYVGLMLVFYKEIDYTKLSMATLLPAEILLVCVLVQHHQHTKTKRIFTPAGKYIPAAQAVTRLQTGIS